MFDPERFLAQLLVIVAATRLVGALAARLRQPRVVGEIAAGLLLGPSLLGRLAPGLSAWLFPPATFPVLLAVSHLGLLFFMFLVGLHLDLGMLRASGRTALVASPVSIVVPLGLGIVVGGVIQPRFAPEVSPLSFALFMGVALSVTAFPVLARILEERGLARTRIGVVAIACAAVDDVTAWCLLAGVTAYVRA
ncbi:MAG TPA: cation:proton antiporter, partial [Vicinamibacteria bacterium]|nr:cation:proton antiporter [Vicinamibacteria bacterium]